MTERKPTYHLDPDPGPALAAMLDRGMYEALAKQPQALASLRRCLANGYTPELIGTVARKLGADDVTVGIFVGAANYILSQEARQ